MHYSRLSIAPCTFEQSKKPVQFRDMVHAISCVRGSFTANTYCYGVLRQDAEGVFIRDIITTADDHSTLRLGAIRQDLPDGMTFSPRSTRSNFNDFLSTRDSDELSEWLDSLTYYVPHLMDARRRDSTVVNGKCALFVFDERPRNLLKSSSDDPRHLR